MNRIRRGHGGAVELLQVDPAIERRQRERTARVRAERDGEAAARRSTRSEAIAGTDDELLRPCARRSGRGARSARSAASSASFGVHMTPNMRNATRIASCAAAAAVALAVPLAALALARGDGRGSEHRGGAELHAGRRAGHRREVRAAAIDRAASHRSRSSPRGRSRRAPPRSRQPCRRTHAAMAPRQALAGIRRAGAQDPERAAAGDDPRVGSRRRQD